MLADYVAHLRSLVDLTAIRPLTVVVDAGNGMAGLTAPAVLRRPAAHRRAALLRARRHVPQPRGEPDRAGEPARPAGGGASSTAPTSGWPSTATPTAASSSTRRATIVSPSVLTALIADRELAREPGGTVIHNLITSRVVPEVVAEAGGTAVRTRVGPLVHQGA